MPSKRPAADECPEYYFTYIKQVPDGDIRQYLESQAAEAAAAFGAISDQQSLHRYTEGKWSIREVLAHVNDCERLFTFRALWFARGVPGGLPSFDQDVANANAGADARPWKDHLDEVRNIRASTISLVRGLPDGAWSSTGQASGYSFSVRSLTWMTAGHVAHHLRLLRERYL